MGNNVFLISLLLVMFNNPTSEDIQTPNTSLKEHVKQLDEMIAEMKSHSQAQEQKYSAVLSSLLSQLTETTAELSDLKTSYNETIRKLTDRDVEFDELLTSHNATKLKLDSTISTLEGKDAQLSELWKSHNTIKVKLNSELSELWTNYNVTKSKLDSTISTLEEKDAQLSELWTNYNATKSKLDSTISTLEEKNAPLSELWTSYNVTKLKLNSTISTLEEKGEEISALWTSYNETVSELHELRAKHYNVVQDLQETRFRIENLETCTDVNGNIGFHAQVLNSKNVTKSNPIIFNRALYDTAINYDKSTGKYLIPMNGTYLIWIDFSSQSHRYDGGLIIRTERYIIDRVHGSSSEPQETTSAISMNYLQQGESIWVEPNLKLIEGYSCKFGAVLLNSH